MLILSRKKGESIVIPGLGVEITLIDTKGDRARLGIEAPKDVIVHRKEVHDAIKGIAAAKAAK